MKVCISMLANRMGRCGSFGGPQEMLIDVSDGKALYEAIDSAKLPDDPEEPWGKVFLY